MPRKILLEEKQLRAMQTALLEGTVVDDFMCNEVATNIQNFIEGAYKLGANPLPHLRRIFGKLNWKFVKMPELANTDWHDDMAPESWKPIRKEIITSCDFFWNILSHRTYYEYYVTARKKNPTTPPQMVYASGTFFYLSRMCGNEDYVDELRSYGVVEVREP